MSNLSASAIPASGTGAAVPSDQVQIRGVPTNTAIGLYPEIRTDIPRSDGDFIRSRTSEYEKSDLSVGRTSGSIKFKIAPGNKSIIPREVAFRMRAKLTGADNLQTYNDVGLMGSIQRAFQSMIIRDGRGTVLQRIDYFNYVTEMLRLKHIPKDVQDASMQSEGLFSNYRHHAGSADLGGAYDLPGTFHTIPLHLTTRAYGVAGGAVEAGTGIEFTPEAGTTITLDTGHVDNRTRSEYIFFSNPPTGLQGPDLVSVGDQVLVTFQNADLGTNQFVRAAGLIEGPRIDARSTIKATVVGKGTMTTGNNTDYWIKLSEKLFYGDPRVHNTNTAAADRMVSPTHRVIQAITVLPQNIPVRYRDDLRNANGTGIHKVGLSDYAKMYRQLIGVDNTEGSEAKNGAWFTFRPFASGFFNLTQFVPMWATNGLEVEFVLESSKTSLMNNNVSLAPNTNTGGWTAANAGSEPNLEINEAWVHYTAIEHSPTVMAALQRKYIRDGLSFMSTDYDLVVESVANLGKANVQFQQGYSMLNSAYFAFLEANVDDQSKDSFAFLALNPDRLVLEFNRAKYPTYGDDTELPSQVFYMEAQKNIGLLDEQTLGAQSWGNFSQKDQQIHVVNFEKYPEGNLTGVDSNAGLLRIRMESGKQSAFGQMHADKGQIFLMVKYNKLVTMWDTRQTIVQS